MASVLPTRLDQAVVDAKTRLLQRFAERLESVVLFGSYAWGDPHAGSDVDLSVVVLGLTERERAEVVQLVADVSVDRGVDLSVLPWSSEQMARAQATELGIAIAIAEKGIPL